MLEKLHSGLFFIGFTHEKSPQNNIFSIKKDVILKYFKLFSTLRQKSDFLQLALF